MPSTRASGSSFETNTLDIIHTTRRIKMKLLVILFLCLFALADTSEGISYVYQEVNNTIKVPEDKKSCSCSWSPWMSGSEPDDMGVEDETFTTLRSKGYHICPSPVDIQCYSHLAEPESVLELGFSVVCAANLGLKCSIFCDDYSIRVACCYCPPDATASLVEGQCGDAVEEIVGRNGEILSPNYVNGSEYGKAANCSWNFSPKKGKDFALVLTVKQLKLFALKSSTHHCLGSYNLTLNNEQIKCDRYAGTKYAPIDDRPTFCKAYYTSPTCTNMSQIRSCEYSGQQTPYPVSMTYFSDGRTEINFATMYFKIAHEFIECYGGEKSITTRAPTTELAPNSTTGLGYTASTNIGDPASTPTVTIALIAVIVFLLFGGIIGGIYLHRRLKSPSSARSQHQQSVIHDKPLPWKEDQPTNAIADVAFHTYEEIQSQALIETPGYEVPQPIGMVEEDEGGYVVPNVFQQGESSGEAEYEEAFQYPEPDYIEPETVQKEPNRRHVTKFKNPQKDRDLPTTSDGYLAVGKNN